jgi:hypothetical protein
MVWKRKKAVTLPRIELRFCNHPKMYTNLYNQFIKYFEGKQYANQFLVLQIFFSYLVCEAIGTGATPGLLCQPRVIMKMIVEKQMECRLVRETEVLGENLPQRYFCPSQNPT